MNTETPVNALESAELSIADYRAIREGREVPKTETPSAADARKADAETAAESDAAEPNSEESKPEEKPAAKKDKLAGRFSELTAKIRTLESQLAAKGGALQAETPKPAGKSEAAPAAAAADPEPVAEKFDSYIDWQKAYIKWELRQDARAKETAAAAAAAKSASDAKAQTWQERVKDASAAHADFAEVAQDPDLPVTPAMADAILESEIGPSILYHLGQNPELAAKIAKLSAVSQVREIGKIESSLEQARSAETTETEPLSKKPVVSKAPAPHKPVGGAASSSAKAVDSMSLSEYRALRESGKLR